MANTPATTVDRGRLEELTRRELERFAAAHPASWRLSEKARQSLIGGVPMPWMMRWAGGFPPFAARAAGASITDVDGHEHVDLCLGDTGAMTGHSPPAVMKVLLDQGQRGLTTMLPTEDSIWVAGELGRRFGLGRWMFTLSATDANRAALRIARQITRLSRLCGEACPGQADEVYFFACWLVGVRWAKTGGDDNAAELGGHVGGGGLGLGGVPGGTGAVTGHVGGVVPVGGVPAVGEGLAGEHERDGALDGAGGAVAGLPGAIDLLGVFYRD